jgi:hypothetical protein
LIWKDPERGIQVRALPPEIEATVLEADPGTAGRSDKADAASAPEVKPSQTAHAPSTSLQVGSTYYLLVPELGFEVPIRVMAIIAKGRWLGRRTDTEDEIYVDVVVNHR